MTSDRKQVAFAIYHRTYENVDVGGSKCDSGGKEVVSVFGARCGRHHCHDPTTAWSHSPCKINTLRSTKC